MRIAFATTLSPHGSTVTGRVIPLGATLVTRGNKVHILVMHGAKFEAVPNISFQVIGHEPFIRTPAGKKRLRGIGLVLNMIQSALKTAWTLGKYQPDAVIIVKPLPANTLGTYLYRLIRPRTKIILDADDFELTANVVTSFAQRIAIQWSHRVAARMSHHIVVATPFLQDHFTNLVNKKPISLIVTGHAFPNTPVPSPPGGALLYLGSMSITSGHRVDLLPAIFKKVLASVPQARLHLAGDGDDIEQLKAAFLDAGIDQHVIWHNRFHVDSIGTLVNQCDVIIDPIDASLTARAKSSFRAMVSLAFAKPLVTSEVGVRSLLIPAQFHDRFFATPGDPSSYAQRVVENFHQPLTRDQQQALHQAAGLYSWTKLAEQYHAILKNI